MDETLPPSRGPAHGLAIIAAEVEKLPVTPGVYRMLGEDGKYLYVGKARNLKKRVVNYTQLNRLSVRIQRMVMATVKMEYTVTQTEAEALLLEANLIKQHQPRYNILLKDDKSYPYLEIDLTHEYPRIAKHRGVKKKHARYFGPFASAADVNSALVSLQKSFLLRPCADTVFRNRIRPCMEYQIKRCSAPCVRKISKEEYAELLEEAMKFLSGKSQEVQQVLAEQMRQASERMQYEKAASLRDRIRALTQVQAKQYVESSAVKDADVVGVYHEGGQVAIQVFFFRAGQALGHRAFFPQHAEEYQEGEVLEAFLGRFYQTNPPPALVLLSHQVPEREVLEAALRLVSERKVSVETPARGEKQKLVQVAVMNAREALERKRTEDASTQMLLKGLAKLFDLDTPPQRIEVYDNSHIMGKHPVGAMVVATAEGFQKNSYRRFTVDAGSLTGGDDYAMLKETLTRRFARLKTEHPERDANWPDLVLIDGGAAHLTVAEGVFADLGINDIVFVCIAKGPDRNAGREVFHMSTKSPFQLPVNDPVLFYLQRLRDEAHRFAIFSHRDKRSRAIKQSLLDGVEGIGPTRKRALLSHFGSVDAIRKASPEDIAKVPGISLKLAEQILGQLK
ncbi:MAG: excinuclease ABC subunit UvrC [Proteobacteria bacterium]|nr:excinuclease ABC subunit UvrC [Pseudomonadota bacterium]